MKNPVMKKRFVTSLAVVAMFCACANAPAGELVIQKPGAPGTTTTTTTTTTVVVVTKPAPPVPANGRPTVRIALLLDTSNSMDGLIGQAKTQLWTIVNQFTRIKHNGQAPRLLVSLYQYGTPSLGADNGFIKQVLPFTTDLDLLSEKLYGLQTNGGDEYCGWAIRSALNQLEWDRRPGDYSAIFIAGNEPFTQGPVEYRSIGGLARDRSVVVNTIFCGQMSEGIATKWKDGADVANGSFMSIDQNAAVGVVTCPQDKELSELSGKLNTTYVYYGAKGKMGRANQMKQDENAAAAAPSVAASRAVSKGSSNYDNSHWDAVDAVREGKVKAENIEAESLPEEVAKLSVEERKAYLDKKAAERAEIQAKIGKLSREREAFLAADAKTKSGGAGGAATLDSVMIQAIQKQLSDAGYVVEQPAK